MLDTLQLRPTAIVAMGLVLAGTLVRLISTDNVPIHNGTNVTLTTIVQHVGQALNGIAGPFAMSAGTVLSAAWFAPEERTISTAVFCTANQVSELCHVVVLVLVVVVVVKNLVVAGDGSFKCCVCVCVCVCVCNTGSCTHVHGHNMTIAFVVAVIAGGCDVELPGGTFDGAARRDFSGRATVLVAMRWTCRRRLCHDRGLPTVSPTCWYVRKFVRLFNDTPHAACT